MSFDEAIAERDAVLDLISEDWVHDASNRAIAEAVLRAGREHPDGVVTGNAVRALLPPWVNPNCVGAMFHRLSGKRLGLIERVPGRWVVNDDRKSHNAGRPLPVWRLTPRAYLNGRTTS